MIENDPVFESEMQRGERMTALHSGIFQVTNMKCFKVWYILCHNGMKVTMECRLALKPKI